MMLGCQDFCGYYEWTFAYLAERFGREALERYWAEAIGGDSQQHYAEAARLDGLRGLLRTWCKTGQEEHCDWTFTLHEGREVLRLDMRECPSKGYLLAHGLNAAEDYCDHCMGWMIPLLKGVGIEVIEHEHNHCGQCWAEIGPANRRPQPLESSEDIRKDARWPRGHLDRWRHGVKQPSAD